MTGMSLRTDGSLGLMPGNHTCRIPIDKNYIKNFSQCGSIFNPDKNIILKYLNYYGEDFKKTKYINKNCNNCILFDSCHPENEKGEFKMSYEDCQAHIYNKMI
jgi:hypothetical protein